MRIRTDAPRGVTSPQDGAKIYEASSLADYATRRSRETGLWRIRCCACRIRFSYLRNFFFVEREKSYLKDDMTVCRLEVSCNSTVSPGPTMKRDGPMRTKACVRCIAEILNFSEINFSRKRHLTEPRRKQFSAVSL
jgi:hypothetical protein